MIAPWVTWPRLRFDDHYSRLRAGDLDEQRLRFYSLALTSRSSPARSGCGTAVSPDREPMLAIAEFNTGRALAFLS